MPRRIAPDEPRSWFNPVKDVVPAPFLTELPWVDDPGEDNYQRVIKLLDLFYCPHREAGGEDLHSLARYLANPQDHLIVWGDVGIGKSWFIRYELLAGEHSMKSGEYHAGIIDMTSRRGGEARLYRQLRPILEMYFRRFASGVEAALKAYLESDAGRLADKTMHDLSDAEREDIEREVTRTIALRRSSVPHDFLAYVDRLLDVLDHVSTKQPLILVVDNMDKTTATDQVQLVNQAVHVLRHSKVRLILPLRVTSVVLRSRFSALHECSFSEMTLHPVDMVPLMRKRFCYSGDGTSLHGSPRVRDIVDGTEYTFPELASLFLGTDAETPSASAELLVNLAAGNAREALALVKRLLYSDQLKSLSNLGSVQHAIAALMLRDEATANVTSGAIIDLFNNEEPGVRGNALIRFRVLEYFWACKQVTSADRNFQEHLERLGYKDSGRLKQVLSLFLMLQIIVSDEGKAPEDVLVEPLDELGTLSITRSGEAYRTLMDQQWYFVCAKRDVYLPENLIGRGSKGEYCSHGDFVKWLEGEEEKEKASIREWERNNEVKKWAFARKRPSAMARGALSQRHP